MSDLASMLRGVVPEGRLETVEIFSLAQRHPAARRARQGGADDHPARERVEDVRDTDVARRRAHRAVPERSDWENEAGSSAGRSVATSGGTSSSSTAALAAKVPSVGRIALLGQWCRFQRPPDPPWPHGAKS